MTLNDQLSFPRQHAKTQRFTLGAPRAFTVSPDGTRVVFLRSSSGTDRVNRLWVVDLAAGERPKERIAADPLSLLGGAPEQLSAQERARRERVREGSGGVVGYAVDEAVETAVFALSGRLFTASLTEPVVRELDAPGPVIDPRLSPDGAHVAYVTRGALRVTEADGSGDRELAAPEKDEVAYGVAEFVAAEEMDRTRGFWWSPESDRLLVARVDTAKVRRWWISDPAHPDKPSASVSYPAAGTPNAEVTLFLTGLTGERTEVTWDRARFPYLARVHWSGAGAPLLLVQSRDQRRTQYLGVNTVTGQTRIVHQDEDPRWLELYPGVPAWAPDGRLVRIADEGGARVLVVGDRVLTGERLHVRAVLDVDVRDILVSASAGPEAKDPETGEVHVYRVNELGVRRVSQEPGLHGAVRGGGTTVLRSAGPGRGGPAVAVLREGRPPLAIASHAEEPVLTARFTLTEAGERRIPSAVLLPSGYRESDGKLPVLLDPYAFPHAQRAVNSHHAHLTSQWFADQGFAVVVADGRGTPGRSPEWEKSIKDEMAAVILQDQVDALHALAATFPLDLARVAIRGWSGGGFLAALAVLRRPDVFHAAVVGAPVTDLRLYDTHYQERYLGDPAENPEVYARNSLITDAGLSLPAEPARPMMIIHGLADDNVVVAHSLRLSTALLEAGRPHEVLPLTGATHMTPQEQIAENLLLLQLDFLKRSLGLS
ncbi:S9 family peptidase [Streptomyces sp. NBC_01497]|uniref:S9 family peptidase n=1 Tax=Streptomyces sp. NBC_01497 TaxID=2903885 RepID=UPI002E2FF6BB|nr:prolyl oligopeptidase family serine peptidase [Streptomyces sp. NBC_01497]